ncbi:rod shape-determining protein [Oscillospiraceae bacterium SCCA1]|nr:rod shape-determining protein [Oscillospiraceae bacterium SCCA1]
MLEALRNMFTCDIGIDLGTANTLVYMKGRGIIIREPSVVAVDARTDELRVRCVGHEAKAIIGAAPNSILAVRPLKDGVIADFDITAAMLQSFIRQACGSRLFVRPRVVICVPSGVTEVERRAVRQAAAKAGARQVTVIEEPMAAAIGAGLPTAEPVGSLIVDIGGGTAEVAVISLSGIVASRSVRCAGDALDQSITSFIKRKYNLLVGERTAEQIKLEIGSACPPDPTDTEHGETTMEIKGRNLVDGLPKDILIRSEEVREAMNENLMRIVEAIKDTLECTPPELSSDIIDRGIMLSGGGALLRGLDTLIQNETGIEVHIAEAPLDCVALGAGAVLDHPDLAGTRREELSYL